MNWKPFLVAMALVGAGCAAPLRPDPPGPLPWERDYPALPVDREDSLPDLSRSPLVLEDVLAAALTRNPGLEAAREMWEAARARPAQVTALPDPTLGYVRFIDEIETRNGPIEQGITLSQMFPFFGKLAARGDVAEAQALAAWERYAARGLEITERTKSAYFELYWLDQAIRITTENKTLLERQLGVAQTQYAAGRVTLQDVLKAQVELSKLSNDLLTLDEVHGTAIARLNMLLDRPPEAPLGIPAGFEIEGFDK
ncbi:MAG: TolC family protein, partial [Planctomycetota bacterium]